MLTLLLQLDVWSLFLVIVMADEFFAVHGGLPFEVDW